MEQQLRSKRKTRDDDQAVVVVSLLSLPGDLLRSHIFHWRYLDCCMRRVCRMVCKRIRAIILLESYETAGRLYVDAARSGYVQFLQGTLLDSMRRKDVLGWQAALWAAADSGRCQVLRWLRSEFAVDNAHIYRALEIAAAAGHVNVLRWGVEEVGLELTSRLAEFAARSQKLASMMWLHEQGCRLPSSYSPQAAYNLPALQWLHEQGHSFVTEAFCECAITQGRADVFRWLLEKGAPLTPRYYIFVVNRCTCEDPTRFLDVLLERGVPFAENLWRRAVDPMYAWRLILDWLLAHGPSPPPFDATWCEAAALFGNLPLLQWLRAHGCPWDERTWGAAVRGAAALHDDEEYLPDERHDFAPLLAWLCLSDCPRKFKGHRREGMCFEDSD